MKDSSKTMIKPYSAYRKFRVSKYALIDVIEAIKNNGGKDIIVTKEDDNLIVKYKPNWKNNGEMEE